VQAKIGKELKARFLRNLPALNKVIRNCQRDAARKYITGIDGRRLFVRSKHAALNTDLQGMGATIANWWLVIIEDMLTEEGLEYGWNADYTFCAWVHDEVQIAARDGLQKLVEEICIEAAARGRQATQFRPARRGCRQVRPQLGSHPLIDSVRITMYTISPAADNSPDEPFFGFRLYWQQSFAGQFLSRL
jgi:hypothetical protein